MQKEKQRHSINGTVVSAGRDKTIKVLVTRRVKHPLYGKYLTRHTNIHVHDEKNSAAVGDEVTIGETRPISKTKFFELIEIRKKASS